MTNQAMKQIGAVWKQGTWGHFFHCPNYDPPKKNKVDLFNPLDTRHLT